MILTATAIAERVRSGAASARDIAKQALTWITEHDRAIGAFTTITADRALADAERVDSAIAAGGDPGPLAGVPFAVKNLFDIAGVTTSAGSKIHAERAAARADATAVARLRQAGAVLVGALNMEEYAYGFFTDNPHHGRTRNPHDPARTAGGSSGGSGAAVAAGLVPFALGSDTNGSIRIPAAFCGVFGLKPTYGRLSRAGTILFVSSLDHIGPLATTVADLAAIYDVLQGPDPADPVCAQKAPEPVSHLLAEGGRGLRIAVADGYFASLLSPECRAAVDRAARILDVRDKVDLAGSEAARAAAYVITSVEAARERVAELRTRVDEFDPHTRYRFLAGALLPADWYVKAQQFRRWYADRLAEVFRRYDVVLAPATPVSSPRFEDDTVTLDGVAHPVRPLLGRFVQALAPAGLPIVVAPRLIPGKLPVGVQIVAGAFREDHALRVAASLERSGEFGAASIARAAQ